MSHTPGYVSPNKPFNLRVQPQGRRQEFAKVAEVAGDVPTDLLNDFIAWYLGYTDELPTRPTVERQRQRHTASGLAVRRPTGSPASYPETGLAGDYPEPQLARNQPLLER